MKNIPDSCKKCGGPIKWVKSSEYIDCQYCGKRTYLDTEDLAKLKNQIYNTKVLLTSLYLKAKGSSSRFIKSTKFKRNKKLLFITPIASISILSIFFTYKLNNIDLISKKERIINKNEETLFIGAIPDQNPEQLNRLYKVLASELNEQLNVMVKYKPVINYPAAVTAFKTGNLDIVWFGGLTGVQARLQNNGGIVLAQRDIDAEFRSVFIANKKSSINKLNNINDLKSLKGKRFTFGSESSTSGRLMPQYFMNKAGLEITDFKGGTVGFSGSHDATLALVQSGSYDAGALNEQVWESNLKRGRINPSKVYVIWRTPTYYDYHWLAQPDLDKTFGEGFTKKLTTVFLKLNQSSTRQKQILKLFGASKFITSSHENYNEIERIARKIGKIK